MLAPLNIYPLTHNGKYVTHFTVFAYGQYCVWLSFEARDKMSIQNNIKCIDGMGIDPIAFTTDFTAISHRKLDVKVLSVLLAIKWNWFQLIIFI